MKLPFISSDKLLKILSKRGFSITRHKGSHILLHKKENGKTLLVVVPKRNPIKIGTLISILKQANIIRDEFLKIVK